MSNNNKSNTKMLIDATHPEETRVVVQRNGRVEEFDFESAARKLLRGNIYLAKVTRVEPSLQAAFVEYGGNRHGFLAFNEIHPDYYQIPVADRQALLEAEAEAEAELEAAADRRAEALAKRAAQRSRQSASDDADSDDRIAQLSDADAGPFSLDDDSAEADTEGAAHITDVEDDDDDDDSLSDDIDDGIEEVGGAGADDDSDDDEPSSRALSARHRDSTDDRIAEDLQDDGGDDSSDDDPDHAAAKDRDDTASDSDDVAAEADDADDVDGDDDSDGDDDADAEDEPSRRAQEAPSRPRRRQRSYKIQEVIKRRQVILVQVVKEERGNKGAALTTYLSLAGRYTVLMPNTARGGGISRKITNPQDRKRLKAIAHELDVPEGMGLIIRTAGAARTKQEIQRDFEYLLRLWERVRDLTLESSAPCLVYEEGDLIKRSIRDLYNKDVEEVVVAGDAAYREASDFMQMLMPSHTKNVIHYDAPTPLFNRYNVERQLNAMFLPQVTLRSGGYIVINQTEALVAIDVNSGKSTREFSIEETAVATNIEAAEEIARQLKLRDLAGLVVIDFIDMEEKRNNRAVERRLKEALKFDRARIQLGRISHFGLMEMSRQRLRTGVLEGSTTQCAHCQGTGIIRSTESIALAVLRGLEDAITAGANTSLNAVTTQAVALYILNAKRGYVADMEARHGHTISVLGSDRIHGANFTIEKGAPSALPTRVADKAAVNMEWGFEDSDAHSHASDNDGFVTGSIEMVDDDDEGDEPRARSGRDGGRDGGDENGNRRGRRRRRGRGRGSRGGTDQQDSDSDRNITARQADDEGQRDDADDNGADQSAEADQGDAHTADDGQERGTGRRRRRGRRGGRRGRNREARPTDGNETDTTERAEGDAPQHGNDATTSSSDAAMEKTTDGSDASPDHRTDEHGAESGRRPRRSRRSSSRTGAAAAADGDDADAATTEHTMTSSADDDGSPRKTRAPRLWERSEAQEAQSSEKSDTVAQPQPRHAAEDTTAVTEPAKVAVEQPATPARPRHELGSSEPRIERVVVGDAPHASDTPSDEAPASQRKGWWQRRFGGE